MNPIRSPTAVASQPDCRFQIGWENHGIENQVIMCSKLVDFACKIWNTATAIQDGKAEDHSDMSRGKGSPKGRQVGKAGRLHFARRHLHHLQVPRSIRGPEIR